MRRDSVPESQRYFRRDAPSDPDVIARLAEEGSSGNALTWCKKSPVPLGPFGSRDRQLSSGHPTLYDPGVPLHIAKTSSACCR
jgi:hypothetical protein